MLGFPLKDYSTKHLVALLCRALLYVEEQKRQVRQTIAHVRASQEPSMFLCRQEAAVAEAKSSAARSQTELAQQHADELASTIACYQTELQIAGEKAARDIEHMREQGASALAAAQAEGHKRSEQQKADHDAAVTRLKEEHEGEMAALTSTTASRMATMQEQHQLEVSELREQWKRDQAVMDAQLRDVKV
jgi:hypothetical protein